MKRVDPTNVLAVLAALWIGAYCSSGCASSPRPATYERGAYAALEFAPEVLQSMFEMQAEYQRETVRCLTGYKLVDTLVVESMAPTWINRSDSASVDFRACLAPGTIGWYHNHPGWDIHGRRVFACDIEGDDVRTLRRVPNFLVAVITCDDKYTLVWRFKDESVQHRGTFPADVYGIATERRR